MKKRPLRVCHVVSSLAVGGAERLVVRLAKAQQSAGDAVTVFALRGGPLEEELRALGVPVNVCPARTAPARALGSASFFERRRFDVVNSHNPGAQRTAGLARAAAGSAVVMTLHGECKRDYGFVSRPPWADGLVAVSHRAYDAFVEQHAARATSPVVVISNGIAPARPARSRQEVRAALGIGDALALVTVARLDPVKDHGTLLRALAPLRARAPRFVLLLVGDGETRGALEALTRALGLEDIVRFLGYRSDIPDLLGASDLFVLPSISEGLPLAALEAMTAGLPVVATAVGGTPEAVRDGVTGRLVPAQDPTAMADAIAEVLGDPVRRAAMAEAGRRLALESFSFDAMVAGYDRFYRSLLRPAVALAA